MFYNGWRYEIEALRAMNCQIPPKFERETKLKNSTEPALFYTACYRFGIY